MDKSNTYDNYGYALIGSAFEVYNELGYGLLEEIYQQAMEIELGLNNIPFESKKELAVYYKSRKLDKVYIPDLYIGDEIIAELKSHNELTADHEAQLLNYLRLTECSVGYLINFGSKPRLEWKRYVLG